MSEPKELTINTYRKVKRDKCERCGSEENLLVHHKDFNRLNNNKDNLMTICCSCQATEHKFYKHFKEAYKLEPRNSKGRFGEEKPISKIFCKNCSKIADKDNPKQIYCEKCKIKLNTRHLNKEALKKYG